MPRIDSLLAHAHTAKKVEENVDDVDDFKRKRSHRTGTMLSKEKPECKKVKHLLNVGFGFYFLFYYCN